MTIANAVRCKSLICNIVLMVTCTRSLQCHSYAMFASAAQFIAIYTLNCSVLLCGVVYDDYITGVLYDTWWCIKSI
jgi:hypothetical protein